MPLNGEYKSMIASLSLQSALARALDTDCEHCQETRRKLFGMFQAAKPHVDNVSTNSTSDSSLDTNK